MCQVPIAMIPRWWGRCKGRMLLGSDAHMTMVGGVDYVDDAILRVSMLYSIKLIVLELDNIR